MADNFSSVTLGIGVDTKQFNKDIGNTGTAVEQALNRMKLSADTFSERWGNLTSGIKDTKRIVSGILVSQGFYALSNALLNAGSAALSFSQNMETAAISMEYFVQGADKVAKAQAYLRTMNEFAARTPFSTEEALSLSKYMQAVGVSMNTTKSFLSVITDTAAATGATDENLQRIVFGLGQMMTKGRLANEEIRQLANANIPIYEILQEQLGLTGKQISNIGEYWVSADKAVVAILNGLEDRYAGAADRISDTMTGMLDTIADDAKIIVQTAGGGIYDALTSKMTTLRDTLDKFREVATEQGSMGLFNTILTELDPSGKVGTAILALIGNTRQLGAALKELYISGQPLINLFGKAFYASITAVEITMTSFAQVANSIVEGLNKLGITTGTTAQVISSLFIAYKAAKWMSFLGEGATAAAYGMYQSISAASALLPASIQASAGVKLLTTSLIGLITYGLTAIGIFSMLNNAFAGLDTSSTDSLFPSDYSTAMSDYEKQMEAYNDKIAEYQKAYESPYSTIEEGASTATDSLADVADASSKAAASVKSDWVAAFDEVYSIPDDSSGGGSGTAAALADLGSLLQVPTFTFPDLSGSEVELSVPDFPWSDVFGDGLLDSDVLDGDWWKMLLPMVAIGGAKYLGDTLAKNSKKPTGDGTGTGSGDADPFQGVKEANQVLKDMSKRFVKIEQGIKDIYTKLADGDFASLEEQEGLYKLLNERLNTANKILDRINKQAVIAGKFDKHLESEIVEAANNLSLVHKIEGNVSKLTELAEQAKDTGIAGDAARKELADIKKLLEKQYAEYVGRNGVSTSELDELLKGIVNTEGLQGQIKTVIDNTAEIKAYLEENNYNALQIEQRIKDTVKLSNSVLDELKVIGADTTSLAESSTLLDNIQDLLTKQTSLMEKQSEIMRLNDIISIKDAKGSGQYEINAIIDELESLKKSVLSLNRSIAVQTALISTGSQEEIAALKLKQIIIEANNKFSGVTEGIIKRYITSALTPLHALEVYTKKLMLDQLEGRAVIKNGINSITDILSRLDKPFEEALKTAMEELKAAYNTALSEKVVPSNLTTITETKLIQAVKELGSSLGAEVTTIDKFLGEFQEHLSKISGHTKELDFITAQIKAIQNAVAKEEVNTKDILDVLDDRLTAIEESVNSLDDFDKEVKKLQKSFEKAFPDEVAKLQKEITEQISVSREAFSDKLDQLSGLQKLANSNLYQIVNSNNEASKELAKLADEVKGLNKKTAGTGTRRGWAFPTESTEAPFINSIKAGYIDSAIVEAGVFDPGRIAMSGGDVAGLFGQSGYGNTVYTALMSNMTNSIKELKGINTQLYTLRSLVSLTKGQILEIPILIATQNKLLEAGYSVTYGDTFFDKTRRLQAQIDAMLFGEKGFVATIDAKALDSFAAKFKPLLAELTADAHGIYTLEAKSFKKLISAADDIAWQLAEQATVMGKTSAWLAILDTKGAGIGSPDMSLLNKYNPTLSKDVAIIKKLIEKDITSSTVTALNSGAIESNLHILRVEIPRWAKETVNELGEKFIEVQKLISEAVLKGADISELITPINTLGEKIGLLSETRYDSSRYVAPTTGDSALNSILSQIERQLKSNSDALQEIARVRLNDVIERLEDATYNGTSSLETRIVDLGKTNLGTTAQVRMTGEELLKIIPTIKDFQNSFETRSTALTTQLGDLVRTMNKAADQGINLLEKISETSSSSLKDLAFQIMATDKNLTGGSSVSTQIQSILSGGTAMPVTNPNSYADISKVLTSLFAQIGTAEQTSQTLKLPETGGTTSSAFIPPYLFEMFLNNLNLQDLYNQLFASMSEEGQKATDEAIKKLQAEGYTMIAGTISGDMFGKNYSVSMNRAEDLPQEYYDAVLKPLQAALEIKNAQSSNYTLDTLLGGLVQKAVNAITSNLSIESMAGLNSDYIADSSTLYKYGLSSPLERYVRYQQDQANPGTYAQVTQSTAEEYAFKAITVPWSTSAEYERWVNNFLKEYETDAERISALNSMDIYSKDFEYLSYLVKYATSGVDAKKSEAMMPYIEQSDLAEVFGLDKLAELGPVVEELRTYITGLPELSLTTLDQYEQIIQSIQDTAEATLLPMLNAQQQYNTTTNNPVEGDYTRVVSGVDFSGVSAQAASQLSDALGLTFKDLSDGLGAITFDAEKLSDNIMGWVAELPETISLDGSTISTQDAEILAQAGIQINGDGTVTFMKAMNENTTGTERNTTLTINDVSDDVMTKLKTVGLSFDFSGGESNLDLSVENISSHMQTAMFKLSTDLSGQVSESMNTALSGLGTVLDSGYFEITNEAVLNGDMTISEYIRSMGSAADALSPELKLALSKIDAVIAQGGEATRQTVATWADGISMPSPIKEEELTDEIKEAFSALGVSFETQGDEFMMVINRVGDQLSDGMTLIPTETWDKLSTDVKTALQQLGVSMVEEAGYVKVDIADALGNILTPEEITPEIQTAMAELGLTIQTEGDEIKIIADATGKEIADGMYTLPTSIYQTLTPDTIAALETLGVGIVTTGQTTMLNFNNIMSGGVASVIELFANQPELWDQIPQAVVDALAAAGISVTNGMISINTDTMNGLVNLGNEWYGYWSNTDQDIISGLGAAEIATDDGLMKIEKVTADTTIPEDVNTYIMKPFSELPAEIQDRLTGGDNSVKSALEGSEYLITNATNTAFVGAVNAVHTNFANMNAEASAGAAELAQTISDALLSAQKLTSIKVGSSYINNTSGAATVSGDPGNYTVRYGGVKYSKITASTPSEAVKMVEQLTGIDIPGYATGGIIDTDGLYRAGEFGAKEGIIPLENQAALKLVGSAIAGQMDTTSSDVPFVNVGGLSTVVAETLSSLISASDTTIAESIHGAVSTIADSLVTLSNSFETVGDSITETLNTLLTSIDSSTTEIINEITSAASSIGSDIANIDISSDYDSDSSYKSSSSSSSTSSTTSDHNTTIGDAAYTTAADAAITAAKADYAAAYEAYTAAKASGDWATAEAAQAAMDIAHSNAEAARATQGYSGGTDGSQYITLSSLSEAVEEGVVDGITATSVTVIGDDGQETTISTVKGSASGSLVTKDALYRAGEGGLNEAIIPLEKPSILDKVGSAIGAYVPSSAAGIADALSSLSGVIESSGVSLETVIAEGLNNAVKTVLEDAVTRDKSAAANLTAFQKAVTDEFVVVEGMLDISLSSAVSQITESIGSLSDVISNLDLSTDDSSDSSSGSSSSSSSSTTSVDTTIAEAKADWAEAKASYNEATAAGDEAAASAAQAAMAAAHAAAEAARATQGYSGGTYGNQYIPITSIAGSASGSLVTKDALYRAGEYGLNEAIVPLENPGVMNQVGQAIYDSMPVEFTQLLSAAVGLKNAGVATASQQTSSYDAQAAISGVVEAITQKVLENVLPAMNTSEETKTPIYVGNLIADDQSLKVLERKLYVIRQTEQTRRS